jgi:hypothetical protein
VDVGADDAEVGARVAEDHARLSGRGHGRRGRGLQKNTAASSKLYTGKFLKRIFEPTEKFRPSQRWDWLCWRHVGASSRPALD